MRINYSLSPELYLDFLRTNFCAQPNADAVPVSVAASPDSLAAIIDRHRLPSERVGSHPHSLAAGFSRS